MSQIANIRDKKDIRKWWSDNPMTYGGTHGKTDYGDGTPEFEFGTREFYQKVDATFYSLAGDYSYRCARVQCRFYDRSTFGGCGQRYRLHEPIQLARCSCYPSPSLQLQVCNGPCPDGLQRTLTSSLYSGSKH